MWELCIFNLFFKEIVYSEVPLPPPPNQLTYRAAPDLKKSDGELDPSLAVSFDNPADHVAALCIGDDDNAALSPFASSSFLLIAADDAASPPTCRRDPASFPGVGKGIVGKRDPSEEDPPHSISVDAFSLATTRPPPIPPRDDALLPVARVFTAKSP